MSDLKVLSAFVSAPEDKVRMCIQETARNTNFSEGAVTEVLELHYVIRPLFSESAKRHKLNEKDVKAMKGYLLRSPHSRRITFLRNFLLSSEGDAKEIVRAIHQGDTSKNK